MTHRFALILSGMLWVMAAYAQTKTNSHRISYFGSVQTGLQAGSSDIDISGQILNGIQYKSWALAAGTGYDGYGLPGIPITLYGQKSFTKLKHKPFVYAQSGISIALKVNDWNVKAPDGKDAYLLNNGFTAEAGIGYQWKVGKKIQLVANTGFAYKHHEVQERQFFWGDWIGGPPSGPDKYNTIDYYYRRFVCRFGISF